MQDPVKLSHIKTPFHTKFQSVFYFLDLFIKEIDLSLGTRNLQDLCSLLMQ